MRFVQDRSNAQVAVSAGFTRDSVPKRGRVCRGMLPVVCLLPGGLPAVTGGRTVGQHLFAKLSFEVCAIFSFICYPSDLHHIRNHDSPRCCKGLFMKPPLSDASVAFLFPDSWIRQFVRFA